MLSDLPQELMTPKEAARWFRRSPSWLRRQRHLLRLGPISRQHVFHVRACRAYVLGQMCGLSPELLRNLQLRALAAACGVTVAEALSQRGSPRAKAEKAPRSDFPTII